MVLNAIGYPKPLTVTGYTSDFFGKSAAYWTAENKPANYTNLSASMISPRVSSVLTAA